MIGGGGLYFDNADTKGVAWAWLTNCLHAVGKILLITYQFG